MIPIKSVKMRFRRFKAMFDKSAWLLMAPAMAGLFLVDPSMARTLLQWMLFGLVISGASVIISRIIFPHIDMDHLVDRVKEGCTASAIVVGCLILFVGMVIFALITWAHA